MYWRREIYKQPINNNVYELQVRQPPLLEDKLMVLLTNMGYEEYSGRDCSTVQF
jgi:hypothetical protein